MPARRVSGKDGIGHPTRLAISSRRIMLVGAADGVASSNPVAGRTCSPARAAFLTWSAVLAAFVVLAASQGGLGLREVGTVLVAWYAVATLGVFFPSLEM